MNHKKLVFLALSTAAAWFLTTAAGAHRIQAKPIVIYAEQSQDNPVSNQPDVAYGIDAAVKAINKAGGIKGHPLQFVFCNEMGDPATTLACNQQGAASDAVAVVAGNTQAANDGVLAQAGLPNIGAAGNTFDLQNPILFPLTVGGGGLNPSIVYALKRKGVTKVAILTRNDATGLSAAALFPATCHAAKVRLVGTVTIPGAGVPDYSPYAQKIKDTGADGVAFLTNVTIAGAMMRQLRSIGWQGQFGYTAQSIGDADAQAIGSITEGMALVGFLPPSSATNVPAIRRYNADMNAAGEPQQWRRLLGVQAWLSVYAFKAVAQSIKGPITRASVLHALRTWPKTKPINLLGLIKWTPSAKGPAILPRSANDQIYYETIKDGRVVLENPKPFHLYQKLGIKLK